MAATAVVAAEATAANTGASPAGRPELGSAGTLLADLFEQRGRLVLGLCRLLLRDATEAEDATQEVFLSAQRSLLRGAVPRDATAWLTTIARNECRARARKRMREPLALTEVPSDLPDPLATAISRMDVDAIWAALVELPRRQRRAFLLREFQGLSYGELETALGVTRPAVESLLFRARQQLRRAVVRANVGLVPIALREQAMRLTPVPGAGRVAVVGVGLGLTAVGVIALPDDHRHALHAQPSQSAVIRAPRNAAAPTGRALQPIVQRASARTVRLPMRQHEGDVARGRIEHRGEVERPRVDGDMTTTTVVEAQEPPEPETTTTATSDGGSTAVQTTTSSSQGPDGMSSSDGDRSGSTSSSSGSDGSSGSDVSSGDGGS